MMTSEQDLNVGFKTQNEFCLYLEQIKQEHGFESYLETLLWYYEHETDVEIEKLARNLNKRVRDAITFEAQQMNLLKEKVELVDLFS